MKAKGSLLQVVITCFIPLVLVIATLAGDKAIQVWSEQTPNSPRSTVIIDAGHGGMDGGAVSCTGVLESHINLQIALRLEPLMQLLGYQTVMIRTSDRSIHTSGSTIAQKKLSDLKERVNTVNGIPEGILVSIHQNYFSDSRYFGGQIFYANTNGSKDLANLLQDLWKAHLNPGSKRLVKPARGVYLMDRIHTTGILIECGFLSNPTEEERLRSEKYQKDICCVIAAGITQYQERTQSLDRE